MFDWLFPSRPRLKFPEMPVFTTQTITRTAMTPEQSKAFDDAFTKFDEAFAELNKAFDTTAQGE